MGGRFLAGLAFVLLCILGVPAAALGLAAWVYDMPASGSGPGAIVAPAGKQVWFMERDSKKLGYLDAAATRGKAFALLDGKIETLGIGFHILKPPARQTVMPSTSTVTPAVTLLTGNAVAGMQEFRHGLADARDLIFSSDKLWFSSTTANAVSSFDPAGRNSTGATLQHELKTWILPSANCEPVGLAAAPDGGIWAVCPLGRKLVHLDPDTNTVKAWNFPNSVSPGDPGIAVSPDGILWIADATGRKLHRFIPESNQFSAFDLGAFNWGAHDVALDSEQNIWLGIQDLGGLEGGLEAPALAKVGNNLTTYELPLSFTNPHVLGITPLDQVWTVSFDTHRIGMLNPVTREFAYGTLPNVPSGSTEGLAIDPDGNVWFTNRGSEYVGYLENGAYYILRFPVVVKSGTLACRISVHNPNGGAVQARMIAYGFNGARVGAANKTLVAKGKWSEEIGALFPSVSLGRLEVISSGPLEGSLLLKDGAVYLDGVPGEHTARSGLSFPFFNMPDHSSTLIVLNNLARMTNRLTLSAYSDTGALLGTQTRSLAPGQSLAQMATDIVASTGGGEGWIMVESALGGAVGGVQVFLSGRQLGLLSSAAP